MIKNRELNIQQQIKEPITTAHEGKYDDLPDENNESQFILFLI